MISPIKNISLLPSIEHIKHISQSIALLDAIIMPEWEYRYFSFNNNWDGSGNEMMASMRNGSGDEYFINFTQIGAIGKVFCKGTSPLQNSYLDSVPNSFSNFKNEPAFSIQNTTFFFWRLNKDDDWTSLPRELNEYPLLGLLAGDIKKYWMWAEEYYEIKIDFNVAKNIFETLNVSQTDLQTLNRNLMLKDLEDDLSEIT